MIGKHTALAMPACSPVKNTAAFAPPLGRALIGRMIYEASDEWMGEQ